MKVEVRNNNVDAALRVLKKKLQRDGYYTEMRDREHYRSKGEKRRLEKSAGRNRWLKEQSKRLEEYGF